MTAGEYPTEIPQPGSWHDFWKWRRDHKRIVAAHQARGEALPPVVEPDAAGLLKSDADSITWSGHASVITRLSGRTILHDPVWSRRIAVIVKRLTEPSPRWEDVPPPTLITISHNHYDHLDASTMRRVRRETPICVPRGVGGWFTRRGFKQVHEFEWWQEREIDGVRVSFVPSRHFSGRTLWDRNKSLFGGWIVESGRRRVYHSGDTGYFPGFQEIGRRYPELDVACLPIGAYLPPWIMKEVHTNPDEASQAFLDVGAKRMLPIHWGTFRLSDEAMDEPPKAVAAAHRRLGITPDRLLLPSIGGPVALG